MHTRHLLHSLFTAGLAAWLLTGCASTESSRLYVLHSPTIVAPDTVKGRLDPSLRVAIGPLRLPAELERPVVITQSSDEELVFSEFHRWGSTLERQVQQVLIRNVATLLDTPGVSAYPGSSSISPDFIVEVSFEQLTGRLGQSASLVARWTIMGKDYTALDSRVSSLTREVTGTETGSYVTAQSLMLADLSIEMAEALLQLAAEANP